MAMLRLAGRRWKRRPELTVMVVVTLSLGIGATTAIFSIADTVLFRQLPFDTPERLVAVHAVRPMLASHPAHTTDWNRGELSMGTWDVLKTAPVFERVGGWTQAPTVRLLEPSTDRILLVYRATSNLLPLLGVAPVAGRHFTEEEDEVPSSSALLRYELWRDLFGSDPAIVGRRLVVVLTRFGDFVSTYDIVGVLPPGFRLGGQAPDVVVPAGISARTHRAHATPVLRVIARMASGVTLRSAHAAVEPLVSVSEAGGPTEARVISLDDDERRGARPPSWLLIVGAGLLLVTGCTNTAGFLLADAPTRRSEMALRAALGGQPAHLIRQLATEQAIVGAASISGGLLLSYWFIRLLAANAPPTLAGIEQAALGGNVIMFSAALAFGTVMACGLVPMSRLIRVPAAAVAGVGNAWSTSSRGHGLLVAAQTSTTVVLVACATVMAETLFASVAAPLGFDRDNLLLVSTTSAGGGRPAPASNSQATPESLGLDVSGAQARTQRLVDALETLPDVVSVAAATSGPFVTPPGFVRLQFDEAAAGVEYPAQVYGVTAAYFTTMRIPFLDGRGLDAHAHEPDAVVVSREFARRYLGVNAVGRRFHEVIGPSGQAVRFSFRVVGVVGDVKQRTPRDDDGPVYYKRFAGDLGNIHHLVVRTAHHALQPSDAIKARLLEVEPGHLITRVEHVDHLVDHSMADERFRALVSFVFSGAALALAALGLYGLTARRVSERRREFGIRAALGASAAGLRLLVMRNVARTVGFGLLGGLLLTVPALAMLKTTIHGIRSGSIGAFAAMTLVLAAVALAAMLIAIRRVTDVAIPRALTETGD